MSYLDLDQCRQVEEHVQMATVGVQRSQVDQRREDSREEAEITGEEKRAMQTN